MSHKSYIQAQFEELQISKQFPEFSKVQLVGSHGGNTKYLNITNEQLEQIKVILLKGEKDEI